MKTLMKVAFKKEVPKMGIVKKKKIPVSLLTKPKNVPTLGKKKKNPMMHGGMFLF